MLNVPSSCPPCLPPTARLMFRNTLVLVAFDHALTNTIFLPFVSAVLHITLTNLPPSAVGTRPPRSLDGPSFPDGNEFAYQDLAVASGEAYAGSSWVIPCSSHSNCCAR